MNKICRIFWSHKVIQNQKKKKISANNHSKLLKILNIMIAKMRIKSLRKILNKPVLVKDQNKSLSTSYNFYNSNKLINKNNTLKALQNKKCANPKNLI